MAQKKRTNPRRIPASMAEIERCKIDAAHAAVESVYAPFLTACWDYMGFDKEKMQELWKAVQRVSESVTEGRATIKELMWTLRHEAEIELDSRRYF